MPTVYMVTWNVSASMNPDAAHLAIDGDINTRWVTAAPPLKNASFTLDLAQPCSASMLELQMGAYAGDFPTVPLLQVSSDGEHWEDILECSSKSDYAMDCIRNPKNPSMRFRFEQREVRYIRIRQLTRHVRSWWSISEIRAYADGHEEAEHE